MFQALGFLCKIIWHTALFCVGVCFVVAFVNNEGNATAQAFITIPLVLAIVFCLGVKLMFRGLGNIFSFIFGKH